MKHFIRFCAGAACASLSLLTVGPVMAEDDTLVQGERLTDVEIVYVAYRDLNLTSASGEKTLRLRIHRAATQLCVPNGITDLTSRVQGWRCRNESIRRAEPQVASVLDRYQNREVAMQGPPISIGIRAVK